MFLDETWIKTDMAPTQGLGLKGSRVHWPTPFSHWKTSILVGGLRNDRIVTTRTVVGLTDS